MLPASVGVLSLVLSPLYPASFPSGALNAPRSSLAPQSLLTLGDEPDFDPFAADYPPAVVESEKTTLRLETTAGDCVVTVDRALSPDGVDRFLALVRDGFFNDQLLYRVLAGTLVQFGVAASPEMHARWQDERIPDEPNRATFRAGTLSFAGGGTNSRSCHFFVALSPNGALLGSAAHETTIGRVEDVDVFERVVQSFAATGYPDLSDLQADLIAQGNEAANAYPKLDRIIRVEVIG
jgi:peptidyl-prolyl cis-trans isomerase A (cyclophilin A)